MPINKWCTSTLGKYQHCNMKMYVSVWGNGMNIELEVDWHISMPSSFSQTSSS